MSETDRCELCGRTLEADELRVKFEIEGSLTYLAACSRCFRTTSDDKIRARLEQRQKTRARALGGGPA